MQSKRERIEQLGRRLEEDAAKFRNAARQVTEVALALPDRQKTHRAWLEQIARGLELHAESLTNEIKNPNHRLVRLLGAVGLERAAVLAAAVVSLGNTIGRGALEEIGASGVRGALTSVERDAERLSECSQQLLVLIDDISRGDSADAIPQFDVPDQYPDTSPPLATDAQRSVEVSAQTATAKAEAFPATVAASGEGFRAAGTGEVTAPTIPIPTATLRIEGVTPDVATSDVTTSSRAYVGVTSSSSWTEDDDATTVDVDSARHAHMTTEPGGAITEDDVRAMPAAD